MGQKLIKRHNDGTGAVVSGESEGGDHMNNDNNPNSNNGGGSNKISNKKFFKSKIDFMAPIKSLRGNPQNPTNGQNQQPNDPMLSDDTYYEPNQPVVFR